MVLAVGALFAIASLSAGGDVPAALRPLLEASCVDCHEGARAKGGLDLQALLDAGRCDDAVLRAVRRRLVRRDMPPPSESERPTDAAYRGAVAAIDAVVPPRVKEVPFARRLNRAQYAGAVRDVLGVAPDEVRALLPADEIGEGFDTTASTLALPPLLMEKYLDAGEAIAARCIPPDSWSRTEVASAEQLVRKGQGGTHGGVAWLATVGTLTARFEVAHRGLYRVTIDACGQFAGDELPLLAVLVDGVRATEASISAGEGSTQPVSCEVELAAGAHTVAARFVNDFWDPKVEDPARRDRNLGVARISLEGPHGPAESTPFKSRIRALAGDGDGTEGLARIASAVGEELFRRPLTEDECDALAARARSAVGDDATFVEQARALVLALLVDPRFLLRIELPVDTAAVGRQRLALRDLASRMAFFLWSSVPDATLRAAVESGALSDDAEVRAQVRRMLADPRARSLSERFATQWLGIDGLESRQLDPVLFPGVDPALLRSMRRETELLFDEVVRGARPVRALVESRSTHVDARLAAHYGLAAPAGDGWVERSIAEARGAGILGHASVLVATSNPTRTSPVKRGKWVLQALLDDAPPPPPPGVPQLPEQAGAAGTASIRELMAAHRANPDCASCHVRMDAIGLAFESSAADGRLRTGFDDASELPDGSILRGVQGVERLLAHDRAFERALARQLLVYALGRGTAEADDPLIDALAARVSEAGSFAALAEGIVLSDAFRARWNLVEAPPRH